MCIGSCAAATCVLAKTTTSLLVTPCPAVCLQVWRGEHYACTHSEYLQVKRQLMAENHGGPAAAADAEGNSGPRSWAELSQEEQGKLLKERLKKYTQKVGRCGAAGLV